MSIKPSFLTGANAKVKLGGKTMAYATDVSYSVDVDVLPVEAMGRYEPLSFEPINYGVTGSMSIVRYTKLATTAGAAVNGNGLDQLDLGTTVAANHFDPKELINSESFDVEIFQKDPAGGADVSVVKVRDCRFLNRRGSISKRGLFTETFSFRGLLFDDNGYAANPSNADTDLS